MVLFFVDSLVRQVLIQFWRSSIRPPEQGTAVSRKTRENHQCVQRTAARADMNMAARAEHRPMQALHDRRCGRARMCLCVCVLYQDKGTPRHIPVQFHSPETNTGMIFPTPALAKITANRKGKRS